MMRFGLAFVFALILATPPILLKEQTWISVTGPAGSHPPEELVLEIRDRAWDGYGGVVSVATRDAVDVRLVGLAGCRTYAQFSAPPGSAWVIRFTEEGSARLEDWTGRGIETGPGLPDRPASGCPILGVSDAGPSDIALVAVFVMGGGFVVIGVLALLFAVRGRGAC